MLKTIRFSGSALILLLVFFSIQVNASAEYDQVEGDLFYYCGCLSIDEIFTEIREIAGNHDSKVNKIVLPEIKNLEDSPWRKEVLRQQNLKRRRYINTIFRDRGGIAHELTP